MSWRRRWRNPAVWCWRWRRIWKRGKYRAGVCRRGRSFWRIDVLINNVGGTIWARPFAEYQPEQIEKEIRRSLFPTLWLRARRCHGC